MGIIENLYKMTAIQDIINNPGYLLMLAIGAFLLYLGIRKQYEPLFTDGVTRVGTTNALVVFQTTDSGDQGQCEEHTDCHHHP